MSVTDTSYIEQWIESKKLIEEYYNHLPLPPSFLLPCAQANSSE